MFRQVVRLGMSQMKVLYQTIKWTVNLMKQEAFGPVVMNMLQMLHVQMNMLTQKMKRTM